MVAAAVGFYIQSVYFLMAVLFMMGVQSTFFGPLKYAILPDHLRPEEIIAGNAIIGTGTFISILLGTILGGVLGGTQIVSVILIALAVLGWIASFRIPNALPPSPDLRVNYNVFVQSVRIIREAFRHRDVLVSILGISWFWLVGFVFLAQFPVYSKEIIGGDQYVATAFLAMVTIGIGLGVLACNILVRGRISTKYSPAAILAMSLAIVFLWGASQGTPPEDGLMDIAGFFSEPRGWAVSLGLILIAAFGGIYIVPLYALVQTRSEIGHRSRTIAANNIINAFFMVGGSLAVMILLAAGLSVTDLFLLLAVLSLPIAWMIRAGT